MGEDCLFTPREKKFTRAHAQGGARRKNHDSERDREFVRDAFFCLCRFVVSDSHNERPSAARKTMITSAKTLARTFLEIPRLDNSSKTLRTFFLLPIIPI